MRETYEHSSLHGCFLKRLVDRLRSCLPGGVCFGRSLAHAPRGSLVFFPYRNATFCCGLAGIVSFKPKDRVPATIDVDAMLAMTTTIKNQVLKTVSSDSGDFASDYLGGQALVADFAEKVQALKEDAQFSKIYVDHSLQSRLNSIADQLTAVVDSESFK